ncbi:MAG: saccharopine dehydrogenase C-terminal domain-containing protein [Candidatus Poseidoniia archaeon]|nr:saccharopine dehydrogenase C-terminal domain-containing protein [Candidatus Poseidoniia archaeon]
MARIAVLGAGLVGALVATKLSDDHYIKVIDPDRMALALVSQRALGAELCAERFESAAQLAGCDLALNCLPGSMGHVALEHIIEAGVDCVDISFTEQDPRALDGAAREAGVTVVPDAGIAPGFSNLLAAELAAQAPARLEIFVGGLPLRREPPWEYAAPFSPVDVVAEYERPARLKRAGRTVAEPALSGCRPFQLPPGLVPEFPDGTALEAFLTDGLRSLLDLSVPEMAEFTLRYSGHAERFTALRDSGALAGEQREATLATLFRAWRLRPGEAEFTHLRVLATFADGSRRGWLVHDNGSQGWSSMARTTGLTACAFAQQLLVDAITGPGVVMPEACAGAFPAVREYLQSRGVTVERVA